MQRRDLLFGFVILLAASLSSFAQPSWDKSSLTFQSGCFYQAPNIVATVCNLGDRGMDGPTTWELLYAPTGNPKKGTVVLTGTVPALAAGQCYVLSNPRTTPGNYMYKVYQRPGHPGTGVLYSQQCSISGTTTTTSSTTTSTTIQPTTTTVPPTTTTVPPTTTTTTVEPTTTTTTVEPTTTTSTVEPTTTTTTVPPTTTTVPPTTTTVPPTTTTTTIQTTTTTTIPTTTTTTIPTTTSTTTSTIGGGGGGAAIPNPPSGLTLSLDSCDAIKVQWVDNSNNEDGFAIEIATKPNGPFTQVAVVTANTTSHVLPKLQQRTVYYVRVRAFNTSGYSAYTAVKSIQTDQCARWDKSSLRSEGACWANCTGVYSYWCNVGNGNMTGPTYWELYYAPSGNPKNGIIVCQGTLPALASGQCGTIGCPGITTPGNYMFKVYQRPGHPGIGYAWSTGCSQTCGTTTSTTTSTIVTQ